VSVVCSFLSVSYWLHPHCSYPSHERCRVHKSTHGTSTTHRPKGARASERHARHILSWPAAPFDIHEAGLAQTYHRHQRVNGAVCLKVWKPHRGSRAQSGTGVGCFRGTHFCNASFQMQCVLESQAARLSVDRQGPQRSGFAGGRMLVGLDDVAGDGCGSRGSAIAFDGRKKLRECTIKRAPSGIPSWVLGTVSWMLCFSNPWFETLSTTVHRTSSMMVHWSDTQDTGIVGCTGSTVATRTANKHVFSSLGSKQVGSSGICRAVRQSGKNRST